MTINRSNFFAHVRPLFRGNTMSQSQVDGLDALLDAWGKWLPLNADLAPNIRWLAYVLATAFHETAQTMQPIREYGRGSGKPYGTTYYGRGYVQLTWQPNYEVQSQYLGVDLVKNPDLALRPDLAAEIILHGMAVGSFTMRRLGQYFGVNPAHDDPVAARQIVNGTNQATLIASYHRVFLPALTIPSGQLLFV